MDCKNRKECFQRTCSTQKVTGCGLRCRDRNRTHTITKHALECSKFGNIAHRRGRGVGINVCHVIHAGAGLLQSCMNGTRCSQALGVWGSDVIRVTRNAASGKFGIDFRTARGGVLEGFEN